MMLEVYSVMSICYAIYTLFNYIVYELNKYGKVKRLKRKCAMTVKEKLSWIYNNSFILSDQRFKPKFIQSKKYARRYSVRYYIKGKNGKNSRIANKTERPTIDKMRRHEALPVIHKSKTIQDFDTDSYLIGVDSHASRCISNNIDHFVTPIKPSRKGSCKGFGGSETTISGEGTIKWKWLDDTGSIHTMMIKGALYVPQSTICLLSPQHADKSIKSDSNGQNRFRETTDSDSCVMTLTKGTRRFIKTVRHTTRTNTPVFRSAPDNTSFNAYCMECEDQYGSRDIEISIMNSEVISDNNSL